MRAKKIGTFVLGVSLGLAVLPRTGGAAESPPQEEAAALRAAARAEIEAVQARAEAALAVFVDRERPPAARLEAGRALAGIAPAGSATALAAVVRDRGEDGAVRALALAALPEEGAGEAVDAAVGVIADPRAGAPLQQAAVRKLQVLLQFTPAGHARQPEILTALRAALRSPEPVVRRETIGFLAIRNDPAAIEVLKASLAAREGGPFPRPEAIALLALGDPRQHFAALRPTLAAADPETRAAAALALAADPVSRPKIRSRLRGPEDPRVRAAALQSLSLHDEDFVAAALAIAGDAGEEPALRELAVRELNRRWNRNQVSPGEVERIQETLRSLLLGPERAPLAVRAVALDVLSVHDPGFREYAEPLAVDPAEDEAIRERARAGLGREAVRRRMARPGAGSR